MKKIRKLEDGIEDVEWMAQQIICPECESEQRGIVDLTTWPWNTYIHTCTNCGYVIMESEWNKKED